jgi:hypothetical protein
LFETQVRPVTFLSTSALIRFSGMPHNPKPPTTSVAPSGMSRMASAAEAMTLSIMAAGRYHFGPYGVRERQLALSMPQRKLRRAVLRSAGRCRTPDGAEGTISIETACHA